MSNHLKLNIFSKVWITAGEVDVPSSFFLKRSCEIEGSTLGGRAKLAASYIKGATRLLRRRSLSILILLAGVARTCIVGVY